MKTLTYLGKEYVDLSTLGKVAGRIPQELLVRVPHLPHWALFSPPLKAWLEEEGKQGPAKFLWLVDFRTHAYPVVAALDKATQAGLSLETDLREAAEILWALRLSLFPKEVEAFASRCGVSPAQVVPVICDDFPVKGKDFDRPVYWRAAYYPKYKEGRKPKPSGWSMVTKAGYSVAEKFGIPVLRQAYFEADDLIAACVRDHKKLGFSGAGVFTVDTDLLQLVTSHVCWYNVLDYKRFRDLPLSLDYWLKRHKRQINSPRDIPVDKQVFGDKSDNIDKGEAPLGIIDLWDPIKRPGINLEFLANLKPKSAEEMARLHKSAMYICLISQLPISV